METKVRLVWRFAGAKRWRTKLVRVSRERGAVARLIAQYREAGAEVGGCLEVR